MWNWCLGQEDPLEKEMATHSSILAWEISQTEEPGGLQSMGLKRVRYDWVLMHEYIHTYTYTCIHARTHAHTHTHTHTHGLARSKPKSYRQLKELCEDSLPKTPHPLTVSCIHMHPSTAYKQILELYRFRTSHVLEEWTSSRKVFTSQPCNCKDE